MPTSPMPCIACGEPITSETDSREHAVPNSVGGWLKVRDFIHETCNNTAGNTWDAALFDQMHALCAIFGVVRERGETPPLKVVTTAGEKLTIQPDGRLRLTEPKFSKTETDKGTVISMSMRDEKEARARLQDLKKQYPNLDVEAEMAEAERVTSYPQGLFHHKLQFGGTEGGRSMVKTAAAMARHLGVPTTACDLAMNYLRDEEAIPPFGYYFVSDLVAARPVGVSFHCVAISGDPQTGLLLGYVEYFGAVRIVTCLSKTYTGPKVEGSYAVNPTTGDKLDLKVALPFDRAEIQAICDYERAPLEGHKAALDAVLGPAMAKKQAEGLERAKAEAVEYAFAHCGAERDAMLTPEQVARLGKLLAERLTAYMMRPIIGIPGQQS